MDKRQARRTIGGTAVFIGGAIAADTVSWIWRGIFSVLTAGAGDVTLQNFPWLNAIGVVGMVAGAAIIFWPKIMRGIQGLTKSPPDFVEITQELHGKIGALAFEVDHLKGQLAMIFTEIKMMKESDVGVRLFQLEATVQSLGQHLNEVGRLSEKVDRLERDAK